MVNTLGPEAAAFQPDVPPETLLLRLRALKHETIGHLGRKQQALRAGLLDPLVRILTQQHLEAARIEAAIILASLCQAPDLVRDADTARDGGDRQDAILAQGEVAPHALQQLTSLLLDTAHAETTPTALAIPCLRALGSLYQAGLSTETLWREQSDHPARLLRLLQRPSIPLKPSLIQQASLVAGLLSTCDAHCIVSPDTRSALLAALADWILFLGPDLQDEESGTLACLLAHVLHATAALCEPSVEATLELALAGQDPQHPDHRPMPLLLLALVRNAADPVRLYAASCLAQILQQGALPRKHFETLQRVVVPILVRLLYVPFMADRTPVVLAKLVNDASDLQQAAVEASALTWLTKRLRTASNASTPLSASTLEGILLAVAALTLSKDEYRRRALDAQIVTTLIAAMQHPAAKVRVAACQCTRSLSRSMAVLRTSLTDATLATRVLALLADDAVSVQTAATGALCNLVLEFSSMRAYFLQHGILNKLVPFTSSALPELRLNTVWALKHIVYAADAEIKLLTVTALTPDKIHALCQDDELSVAEQAMELLRNLICGKADMIDKMLVQFPEASLLMLLERKLRLAESTAIVASALYTLVHLAAGNTAQKQMVLSKESIVSLIMKHLANPAERCRAPAVWILINLTWSEEGDAGNERMQRVVTLERLGFLHALRALEEDPSQDIRERVKTALLQMQLP